MIKMNPVRTDGLRTTTWSTSPDWTDKREKPRANPTSILKIGPAKQAVIAMFAKPLRAIVMSAVKSDMLFPHARIVKPMMELGILQTTPTNSNKLTS
jgi:hypothetical protein